MSDEKPPEKPTVKFDAPPKWAQEGFTRIHEGIVAVETRINTRLDEQDGKLDTCITGLRTVTNEVERHNDELRKLHQWQGGMEERVNSHSMRAKTESQHDDAQDTKLQELENRLTIAAEKAAAAHAAATESSMRAIFAEMKDAAKTPNGQRVVQVLVGVLIALGTFVTGWLTHGGAK